MSIHWIAAAAMAASAIATSVSAEEQTLRFRVVLTKVSTRIRWRLRTSWGAR